MARVIDYWYTPVSPYVYLGHDRLVRLARDAGAHVELKPVDMGRVFAASGGLPLARRAPQRQAYRLVELRRWSEFLGMPLNLKPRYFPCPGDLAAHWILAAKSIDPARALSFAGAIGKALWADERDPTDTATLAEIAAGCGLDAGAVAAGAADPQIMSYYDTLTQQAIDAGVFGAPTYVVDGEMFWGQDRLDLMARKLAK
ncbi:MAG: 2-hydroxychromene-2-carboxylate isomerase [Betaproteobacteria bacterium]